MAVIQDLVLTFTETLDACIEKIVFWDFDSIIMQNFSDVLPLFCTPTWPSHHVNNNQE